MWLTLGSAAVGVALLDKWTKRLIAARPAGRWSVAIAPGVSIRHLRASARGVAPGVFVAGWLLTATALLAAMWTGRVFTSPAAWVGIGAALGGAASNVHDRLRHGCIVDFVCVGWWPAFNVADTAIVVGAAVALVFLR